MKNKLKKLKSHVQFNTRRWRFIGLETLLFSVFLIGTSVVNDIFLDNYTSVRYILNSDIYLIYSACMLFLMAILASVFMLLGAYIQVWFTEKAAARLLVKLKKDPQAILDMLQNGDFNGGGFDVEGGELV